MVPTMTRKRVSRPQSCSTILGYGLAHVQNTIDTVCDWGFQKMREAGNQPVAKKKSEKKVVATAKRGVKSTLRFLGSAGEAYYDRYEELKARKKRRK